MAAPRSELRRQLNFETIAELNTEVMVMVVMMAFLEVAVDAAHVGWRPLGHLVSAVARWSKL